MLLVISHNEVNPKWCFVAVTSRVTSHLSRLLKLQEWTMADWV